MECFVFGFLEKIFMLDIWFDILGRFGWAFECYFDQIFIKVTLNNLCDYKICNSGNRCVYEMLMKDLKGSVRTYKASGWTAQH